MSDERRDPPESELVPPPRDPIGSAPVPEPAPITSSTATHETDPALDPDRGSHFPPITPPDPSQLGSPSVPRRNPVTNAVLFALTLLTTIYWGFIQYQSFYLDEVQEVVLNPLAAPHLMLAGVPYGLAVIAFLLSHEMGHYLACRYYGIGATLPYFIPIPPVPPFVLLPGTMGAVIRILSPLKSRRALFDVAIAGPLAGFIVALPILAVGLAQSRVVTRAELGPSIEMGEPLIWGPLQALFAPPVGAGETLLAHPLAFIGWFALLVTAMNLLPIGQLDGGHLLYALLPRHHRKISLAMVGLMFYAGFRYFTGWFVFGAIVLFVLGTKHPRPLVFEQRLGAGRILLLLIALAIFVTSFTLVPVTIDF